MAENKSSGDDIKKGVSGARKAASVAKKGVKAAKAAKGAKATAAAAKGVGAALSVKVILIIIAIVVLFSVLTVFTPSTSFNSFTHVNEAQDEVTDEELNGEVTDLTPAKEAEIEGVNILGTILKEEKLEAYEKLKDECDQFHVDYEATLQFLDANFAEIGGDVFSTHADGKYTEDEYDACCILSAYSISVGNLFDKDENALADDDNWREDMEDKLRDYLDSDEGEDFYEINIDVDEDGNAIKYEGVIDETVDIEGEVDDYEDEVDEDLIDPDEVAEGEDTTAEEDKEEGSSAKDEKDDKEENKKEELPELKSVEYVKANTGIDIYRPVVARKLIKDYFLLGIMIFDTQNQTIMTMLDADVNPGWANTTLAGLKSSNAKGSNGKLEMDTNQVLKMLGRY